MINLHAVTAHVLNRTTVERLAAIERGEARLMPDNLLSPLIRDGYATRGASGPVLTLSGRCVVNAYKRAGWTR